MSDDNDDTILDKLQRIRPDLSREQFEQIRDERLDWSHELERPGVWDGVPSLPRPSARDDAEDRE